MILETWISLIIVGVVLLILAVALKRWTPPEVQTILWILGIVLLVIGILVLVF